MLAKYRLSLIFIISLLASWFVPFLFPFCRFLFFAPFLITCLYQKTLWSSLWIASGIGMWDDLFTMSHFGVCSCNYVITCAFLYRIKRHFFEDNPFTLFIMTLIFSLVSTMLKTIFYKIFSNGFPLTIGFIATDIFIMPLFEGICAYLLYILPYQLFKIGKRYRQRVLSK